MFQTWSEIFQASLRHDGAENGTEELEDKLTTWNITPSAIAVADAEAQQNANTVTQPLNKPAVEDANWR